MFGSIEHSQQIPSYRVLDQRRIIALQGVG
jgi:hypothetical protein